MPYSESMERYGNDKPDLRNPLELKTITHLLKDTGFKVFADTIANGGTVKALNIPKGGEFARSEIDQLVERSKELGAKGLAWAKVLESGKVNSTILKFVGEETFAKIV